MNKKTFYVTTPIYYPSGNLHIGHVYTTTLAWVLKNYKTLNGYDAKFLTGSDEHGQKIQQKAEELGKNPQEYVDEMAQKFKDLWVKLDIEYDYFSRTTNPSHEKSVQNIFSKLYNQGDIYKGSYKGLYSVSDEEFFTKIQATKGEDGNYYHPLSNHKLVEVEEESYFFEMSKYREGVIDHYEKNENFIIPKKIVNELMTNFLEKGLEDLSVTRTSFTWGIPIKEDPKHVIYVWLDALTNYITKLGYGSEDESDFIKYWQEGDEVVHVMGKEITRFHCIYWPIILHSLGIRQPNTILSHGWIITPEGKMSKSKGNVIDPIVLLDKYGPEQIKYFFASQINIGKDGIFDEDLLKSVINSHLANNFGNLLSRTIAMTKQNFDGPVKFTNTNVDEDEDIRNDILESTIQYKKEFDNYQINKALNVATNLSKKLNVYVEKMQPWNLKDNRERLEQVLNLTLNGIYAITTMLSVVIPRKTENARKMLGIEKLDLDLINDFTKFDKIIVEKGNVLFERIK